MLAMVGKYMFDPAMQAYFGDRIPYHQRGTALAVTEVAWSLSFIAACLCRRLFDRPLWLVGAVSAFHDFGACDLLHRLAHRPREDPHHNPRLQFARQLSRRAHIRPCAGGISIALWASAANELVNVIFGVWLEDSFGLKIIALAGASAVIGISELSGEGLVALTTDRLGKPLALTIGLISNALAAPAPVHRADPGRRADRAFPLLHHLRICPWSATSR
jgi:hypothetical protein